MPVSRKQSTSKPRRNKSAAAKVQYASIDALVSHAAGFATKLQLAAELLADASATAQDAHLDGTATAAHNASQLLQAAARAAGIPMRAIAGYPDTSPQDSADNLASAIAALNMCYQALNGVPGGAGLLRAVYNARMQAAGVRDRLRGAADKRVTRGPRAPARKSAYSKATPDQLVTYFRKLCDNYGNALELSVHRARDEKGRSHETERPYWQRIAKALHDAYTLATRASGTLGLAMGADAVTASRAVRQALDFLTQSNRLNDGAIMDIRYVRGELSILRVPTQAFLAASKVGRRVLSTMEQKSSRATPVHRKSTRRTGGR